MRSAGQDLATLRALKKGEAVKPSVYGHLTDSTNRGKGVGCKPLSNFSVELRSGTKTRSYRDRCEGSFAFADLPRGEYQFHVAQPGWRSQIISDNQGSIDLNEEQLCRALRPRWKKCRATALRPRPEVFTKRRYPSRSRASPTDACKFLPDLSSGCTSPPTDRKPPSDRRAQA